AAPAHAPRACPCSLLLVPIMQQSATYRQAPKHIGSRDHSSECCTCTRSSRLPVLPAASSHHAAKRHLQPSTKTHRFKRSEQTSTASAPPAGSPCVRVQQPPLKMHYSTARDPA